MWFCHALRNLKNSSRMEWSRLTETCSPLMLQGVIRVDESWWQPWHHGPLSLRSRSLPWFAVYPGPQDLGFNESPTSCFKLLIDKSNELRRGTSLMCLIMRDLLNLASKVNKDLISIVYQNQARS